jgi:hypothetical protein
MACIRHMKLTLPWPEIARKDAFGSLTKRQLKRLHYWRVVFHDGTKHLPPLNVIAPTKAQARVLAESAIMPLYGTNVVFLKAVPSPELPIELNEEAFQLISEKAGIHL